MAQPAIRTRPMHEIRVEIQLGERESIWEPPPTLDTGAEVHPEPSRDPHQDGELLALVRREAAGHGIVVEPGRRTQHHRPPTGKVLHHGGMPGNAYDVI